MGDLRLAFRTLRKTPFITAVAILSLALGIGANAAIFSLLDQILIRSLPVEEPDRLVNLKAPGPKPGATSCNDAGGCDEVFSYPMFRDLARARAGFAGLAAHRLFGANLALAGRTISGRGVLVSGSYFPLLGVRPALGRLLGPADDENVGEHFVAVLGHGYWERELGADPGVLNQTLVVNGQPMTVVGVAQAGFEGTTRSAPPDVYVPITMRGLMSPGWEGFENRRSYWAYVFGRLRADGSLEQAAAEANALYASILEEVEAPLQENMSDATMERFRAREILFDEGRRGQSYLNTEARTPLLLLLATTAVVLLIACANIANLLLARGARRAPEVAIRASLGAGRGQLLRQFLAESLLLALVGGAASLLVAHWTLGIVAALLPGEMAAVLTFELRPAVVLFAGALALGTGFLFGFYPALHSTRTDLVGVLKSGAGQPAGSRSAARFRSALVTGQIALSMALLVGAGLFLKSLVNLSRVDLGIEASNVVTFGLSPELNGYEAARSAQLFQRVEEELAAIPGVTAVSSAMVPLIAGSSWGNSVSVEGFEWGPDVDTGSRFNAVGPGYFATVGIPLLAGREFTAGDVEGAPKVAIVNEAFTRKFGLDGRNAVGRFMATSSGPDAELDVEIVGVVQDAKYSDVKQEAPPLFFTPHAQSEDLGFLYFYARTALDPAGLVGSIPTVVRRLDANLPVEELKTLEEQISESVVLDRLISSLSTGFAILATLLAGVGLYGVLAYTVAQRTREIGLRMALGAGADRVRALVLRQVTRMTVVGGIIGAVAAVFMGRAARSLLFGLEGHDPWVMGGVAVLLAAIAFAAGYVPALKASKVDPMQALRYE